MTTVNQARFTIDGTPAQDPSTGDPKYVATNSQTLDCTLEQSPSAASAVVYEVFDPNDEDSPLASFGAPNLTWVASGTARQNLASPNDTAQIIMPASGFHTYKIRCTATLATGTHVYERTVGIETTLLATNIRKTIPAEVDSYYARGYSDELNKMAEAINSIAVSGPLTYQGTWNANTNTPALASGVGTKGDLYVVSVAGTTNLDGISDWQITDWAVFNGTAWEKIDNTDLVVSVNGLTGAVLIGLDEVYDKGGSGAGRTITADSGRVSIVGDLTATAGLFEVVQTPSAPGLSATIASIEAQGGNWQSGSRALEIISDDDNAVPLVINNGSTDTLTFHRYGSIVAAGSLTLSGTVSKILATSNTLTSGILANLVCTPAASGTATVLQVEAQGTNWTGGIGLNIICDDANTKPFVINNGTLDTFWFKQDGSLVADSGSFTFDDAGAGGCSATFAGGVQVGTTGNGDVTLVPAGSGIVQATLGASSKVLIDAATTPNTTTAGALDVNIITATDAAVGVYSQVTSNNISTGLISAYRATCNGHASDSGGSIVGLCLTANADGSATKYGIYCNDADFDYAIYTNVSDIYHGLGASDKVLIDAATTPHTGTAGALDVDITTATSFAAGLNISLASDNISSGVIRGGWIQCAGHASDSGGQIQALRLTTDNIGSATKLGLYVDDADFTWGVYTLSPLYAAANVTVALGATDKVFIDAATTPHTGTAGALDLNITTATSGAVGGYFTVTSDNISTGTLAATRAHIAGHASDSGGILAGLQLSSNGTGSASHYGVYIDDADFTYGIYTNNTSVFHGLGATDRVLINAATVPHTGTAGALDLNITSVTDGATGLNSTMTSNNISTGTLYAAKLTTAGHASDSGGNLVCLQLTTDEVGSAARYGLFCNDADFDYAIWLDNSPLTVANNSSVEQLGANGSQFEWKTIDEELTIAVGQGTGGVATSGSLAPSNSLIMGVACRVTQAPGGGATSWDLGITGSGNVDELIDNQAVALGTTANSPADNDGTQLPLANGSPTTLTLTTDANVTVSDMKVRIVVFYVRFTAPSS
jgi:hypothetical protein